MHHRTKTTAEVLISFLILLALIIVSRNLYAQDRFPVAPAVPTTADCQNLNNAYLSLYRDGENQTSACLSGPANFGEGAIVTGTCNTYDAVRAYPQCSAIEVSVCQLGKRMLDETGSCFARVPDNIICTTHT
jgi:hypothetical protein